MCLSLDNIRSSSGRDLSRLSYIQNTLSDPQIGTEVSSAGCKAAAAWSWQFTIQCRYACLHGKVKISLGLIKHHALKTYEGVEVQLHNSWPRQEMEVSGQLHALAALSPGKLLLVPIRYDTAEDPESVCTLWRREKLISYYRESKFNSSVVRPVH
jgi:hypothetical protein